MLQPDLEKLSLLSLLDGIKNLSSDPGSGSNTNQLMCLGYLTPFIKLMRSGTGTNSWYSLKRTVGTWMLTLPLQDRELSGSSSIKALNAIFILSYCRYKNKLLQPLLPSLTPRAMPPRAAACAKEGLYTILLVVSLYHQYRLLSIQSQTLGTIALGKSCLSWTSIILVLKFSYNYCRKEVRARLNLSVGMEWGNSIHWAKVMKRHPNKANIRTAHLH